MGGGTDLFKLATKVRKLLYCPKPLTYPIGKGDACPCLHKGLAKMKSWFVLAGAAGLMVSGCASPKFEGRPELTVTSQAALPPPDGAALIAQERPYLIGPFDELQIDVFGSAELSRSVQVDANGQIDMPFVDALDAAGKTVGEVAVLVEERLKGRYVREPQVNVRLTQTSKRITVDGDVKEPGLYPVAGRMTLMRAVATAKGLGEYARPTHVVVFRRVGNKEMAALHDLRAIRLGAYPDPELYANDVVVVGTSQARRIFRDVLSASGLIMAPVIALLNRR